MNYAAEYVFPGHPDKLCDAIADALVEEAARREKRALCGIEVAVHRASVFITGRIACAGAESDSGRRDCARVLPLCRIRRRLAPRAGGGRGLRTNLCLGPLAGGRSRVPRGFRRPVHRHGLRRGFARHQLAASGTLAGVASVATPASGSARKRRNSLSDPTARWCWSSIPKGVALAAFSASMQQKIGGSEIDLHRAVRDAVADELQECARDVPGFRADLPEQFHVNGAGNFEVGGPEGDNGLSGKKLVVDAYGPRVPIGGGALSGKDFFKADRAGAVLARRLAKTVVAAGVAGGVSRDSRDLPGRPGHSASCPCAMAKCTALDPAQWASLMDLSLVSAGERYALTPDLPAPGAPRPFHFRRTCVGRDTLLI